MNNYPRNNTSDPSISEKADPRRLVEDVIREAEALIQGHSPEAAEVAEEKPSESDAIERVQGLTQGLEDLAAEVADLEASMVGDPGDLDLTARTVARTPVVASATPTVDLVGSSESFSGGGDDPAATDSPVAPGGLDQVVSQRVQQSYENIERLVADARDRSAEVPSLPTEGSSEEGALDQARAAERAAMAAIDAELGSEGRPEPSPSHLLRETATNVDAEIGGLVPIDDGPEMEPVVMNTIEAEDPAPTTSPIDVVAEEIDESEDRTAAMKTFEDESEANAELDSSAEPTTEPEDTVATGGTEDAQPAFESSRPRSVDRLEDDPRSDVVGEGDRTESASLLLRVTTKPMRVLPESIQPLATALAASLVVWVPIAWAWAIFAPEPTSPVNQGPALSAPVVADAEKDVPPTP